MYWMVWADGACPIPVYILSLLSCSYSNKKNDFWQFQCARHATQIKSNTSKIPLFSTLFENHFYNFILPIWALDVFYRTVVVHWKCAYNVPNIMHVRLFVWWLMFDHDYKYHRGCHHRYLRRSLPLIICV